MVQKVQIPKVTVIAINGSGGAQVLIAATQFSRYVEITECPPNGGSFTGANYAPQGLNYQRPDDGYVATEGLLPSDTLTFGDKQFARDRTVGVPPTTDPAGTSRPGTPFIKVKSATVTATQVQVSEWP